MAKSKPIRLAIVGGRRGGSFNRSLEHLSKRIKLTAVCDFSQPVLDRWEKEHPGIHTYDDYDKLLKDDTCDAVLIATPMQVHAEQACKAMRAGRHVMSEVTACISHTEAKRMIKTVEQTGMTYMMAENYCYMRPHMMVKNMVDKGVFGELTYAEGMYLHAVPYLWYNEDGSETWRGQLQFDMDSCHMYPTHSFGPIANWMGINKTDKIDTVYSMSTPAHAHVQYVKQRFGEKTRKRGSKEADWSLGDSTSVMIKTKLGRVVYLRFDCSSQRPHHMATHELQGDHGCFRTAIDAKDEPYFWIDGVSPGGEKKRKEPSIASAWDRMEKFRAKYDHPRWKKFGEQAKKAGHGGGDFFVLEDFVNAIENKAPNPCDIYDAATWSSIIWLSAKSEKQNRPVKAIDYCLTRDTKKR